MSAAPIPLRLHDASATELLGVAMAHAYVRTGRGAAVLYLRGDLGAGKTTCARSLLRTLGVQGLIRSPTYTLIEPYELSGLFCAHVDLYRVRGPEEVDELGLRDYLDGDSLLLIEWPERGGSHLAASDLELFLDYADESRSARLESKTARGRSWLEHIALCTSL